MRQKHFLPTLVFCFATAMSSSLAHAATSGSFVFDLAGDVGDNADGPQYDITLIGATDDGGGCDQVVMMMVDAAGVVVDVDPICISGGAGSDDGDHGTIFPPTTNPITYTLYDIDGAEATALGLIAQNDPAYLAYLLANGTVLDQDSLDHASNPPLPGTTVASIPTLDGIGLILASLSLAIAAAVRLRRRG